MLMVIGALQRMVARRMTTHAARVRQYFSDLAENRARSLRLVCDSFELGRALEALPLDNLHRAGLRHCGRKDSGRQAADRQARNNGTNGHWRAC
jgi:hypothetical protein